MTNVCETGVSSFPENYNIPNVNMEVEKVEEPVNEAGRDHQTRVHLQVVIVNLEEQNVCAMRYILPFHQRFVQADTRRVHRTNSGSCRTRAAPCVPSRGS